MLNEDRERSTFVVLKDQHALSAAMIPARMFRALLLLNAIIPESKTGNAPSLPSDSLRLLEIPSFGVRLSLAGKN